MHRVVLFLLISCFFTSCIPTKDLIYLQGDKDSQSPVVNALAEKPYRLHAHDMLAITINASEKELLDIFKTSEDARTNMNSEIMLYFNSYIVDEHGNIRLPILNEVNVLGYTIEEVQKTIEKRLLEEYFTDRANLFVTVKLGGFRYTTNGEVGSPGTVTLYQNRVTIMDAIANSGDITLTGDRKNVLLIRHTDSGIEMHTLDLTKTDVMNSPYFYLQPNDYIYVKPLPQKSWGTGSTGVQTLATVVSVLSLFGTITILLTRL